MKTTSYTQLNTYETSGNDLTIYWDEEEHEPKEGESEIFWTYSFCRAFATDSRSQLIEKIIASQYPTYGSEIAAICNGGESAQAHDDFRVIAKQLADGWIDTKADG